MTAAKHVKAVHLIVDHDPDPHLAAFELTPALGKAVPPDAHQDEAHHRGCAAIAETSDGEVWADYCRVSVSLNGCG